MAQKKRAHVTGNARVKPGVGVGGLEREGEAVTRGGISRSRSHCLSQGHGQILAVIPSPVGKRREALPRKTQTRKANEKVSGIRILLSGTLFLQEVSGHFSQNDQV